MNSIPLTPTRKRAAAAAGYDARDIYDGCEQRGIRPVIPLKKTPAVVAGKDRPPSCEHGTWTFAGSDAKRGASKWRCPAAECRPGSVWVKADRLHPLVPRSTDRWKALYRGRAAVEREFGNLVAVEVKAGANVRTEDLAGLRHLARRLGDRFVAGYVLYTGQQTLPFGGRLRAVSIEALWRVSP